MNCPRCGAANPDNSVFCRECAAPMEENVREPQAPAPAVAAEGVVRCRTCGAENAAGAVFSPTCRGVLGAPTAGQGTAGSLPSELKPRSEQVAAPRPVGHPDRPLPKRCPFCGGPIYPEQIRCSRCGESVLTLAALEREFSPVDTRGPTLYEDNPQISGWPELTAYLIVELLVRILRVLSGILRPLFEKVRSRGGST